MYLFINNVKTANLLKMHYLIIIKLLRKNSDGSKIKRIRSKDSVLLTFVRTHLNFYSFIFQLKLNDR